jgi:hypothetical protein
MAIFKIADPFVMEKAIVPLYVNQPHKFCVKHLQMFPSESDACSRPYCIKKEETCWVLVDESSKGRREMISFFPVVEEYFYMSNYYINSFIQMLHDPLQIILFPHGLVMMHQNDILARNMTKPIVPIAYRMSVSVMAKIFDSFVGDFLDVVQNQTVFGIVSDNHLKTDTLLLQYRRKTLL